MGRLAAYLPMDRRHELAGGEAVPDRARGVALFADLAGFTQLTDRLATSLGPGRGAEELTRLLDAVLGGIVGRVHRYRGSVVDFGGDGVVAWFAGDVRAAALSAALGMDDVVRTAARAVAAVAAGRAPGRSASALGARGRSRTSLTGRGVPGRAPFRDRALRGMG